MNNKNIAPRGTDQAKLIKVIQTKSVKGSGTVKDPVRSFYQYWDLKGNLLASKDSYDTSSSASSDVSS